MAKVRVRSVTRKSKVKRQKKSRSKRKSPADDGHHGDLISQFKSKKTWALIALALGLALIFQQFNLVTLVIDDNLLPSCTKHEHCTIGKSCVWGKCYAHTPDYPEIGKVKIFSTDGTEVIPDVQGFFRIPARRLMYFEVQADNDRQSFKIEVYSQVGLGQKGLDKNRQSYFSPLQPGDQEHKNLYWVHVDRQERDYIHKFYFELVGFPEERFNMFVYLKNISDIDKGTSEIVEIPIRII